MVTSPNKWKILEQDEKPQTNISPQNKLQITPSLIPNFYVNQKQKNTLGLANCDVKYV